MVKDGDSPSKLQAQRNEAIQVNENPDDDEERDEDIELLSPYKQKELLLLNELRETVGKLDKVEKEEKLATNVRVGAKMKTIMQAIKNLQYEHRGEKQAYEAAVLLAREENEWYNDGEQMSVLVQSHYPVGKFVNSDLDCLEAQGTVTGFVEGTIKIETGNENYKDGEYLINPTIEETCLVEGGADAMVMPLPSDTPHSESHVETGKIYGKISLEDFHAFKPCNYDRKLLPKRGCLVNKNGGVEANVQQCTASDRRNVAGFPLSEIDVNQVEATVAPGNKSVQPSIASYADKVIGGIATGGAEFRPGERSPVQLRHHSFEPGSPIIGTTATMGTVGKQLEPRPGARSNVPLWFCPFTPGSPINDLVTDAGTVEKLNNCIVGHFLGARMDYYDVRKEMFHQWESCGLEKMWCTDNGIYLFKFKATNRIDEILEEAHCHVFGKVMVLKRWHQMQKLSKEAVFKVPIWVKIYELPFEFWLGDSVGENLSKIASRIGRLLYIDTATEKGMRLSFARVCVEIDVSALLPNSITIEFGGESVDLKVQYQWVPQKCEKCGAFGHKGNYCPLNPKTEEFGEKKSSKAKAPIYGGITIRGNGGKVFDKNWKVVQKGKWESRINSIINSEEELENQEGNKWFCYDVHGKKAQVKGNLTKDKGHLKSGNSFAVLQSIQGENHRMDLNRGRKEVDAIGASRVEKSGDGEAVGVVGRDIFGDLIAKDSGFIRNPEEDRTLFEAFVTGKEADALGSVTPKPKKIWTEHDFPIE